MQGIVEINFLDLEENEKLKSFAQKVVNVCFQKKNLLDLNFYLSITLTTPEQIHKLNREFKKLPFDYGVAVGYSMILDDVKSIEDATNEAVEQVKSQKEELKDE